MGAPPDTVRSCWRFLQSSPSCSLAKPKPPCDHLKVFYLAADCEPLAAEQVCDGEFDADSVAFSCYQSLLRLTESPLAAAMGDINHPAAN